MTDIEIRSPSLPSSLGVSASRRSTILPDRLSNLSLHLGLVAFALAYLTPFFWLICAAFKQPQDVFNYSFLPWRHLDRLTFHNFTILFSHEYFARWLINSLFVSSLQTILVVTFSSLCGFALAKYEFHGKRLLMLLLLSTLLLPGVALLPGYLELMVRIGWLNSYKAIIVPGAASVFGAFLFRQAMQSVPDELLQAGRVDGCSELRLWWDVALPVVRPIVGAFTLLSFWRRGTAICGPRRFFRTSRNLRFRWDWPR